MWRVPLCMVLLFVRVAGFGSWEPPASGVPLWGVQEEVAGARSTEIVPYIPAWRSILDRVVRKAVRREINELMLRLHILRGGVRMAMGFSGYGCSALASSLLGPAGRLWIWAFG